MAGVYPDPVNDADPRLSGILLVHASLGAHLAAAAWALRRRRFRYLLYSATFPVAVAAWLRRPDR
ncbi:MAG: hypothetical protein AVDCRST_MAG02-3204 [uncultured Rubrobacteraceae bacterium]|uniref:Uncharacterized protein n=1 Tax=uncultured Rubrobacteraceae bacterium TaxID=349277 RepID=A0A6J4R7Z5_9ACTN|nr:MAG: hypothetical protein AVDCRST_MAG02-3204 [uncultured Rubrobacteraceae bacterium]